MVKRFLGWDCANKTLAWSHFDVDVHIYSKIYIICDEIEDILTTYLGRDFVRGLARGLTDAQRDLLADTMEDPEFIGLIAFALDVLDYFMGNFIEYLSAGVVDVLEGRKVSDCDEIERSCALHKFLSAGPVSDDCVTICDGMDTRTHVVIEHQPSKIGKKTNNKSTMVGHQLMFYYIGYDPVIVNPKLKNNIALADHLVFSKFLEVELPKHKEKKDTVYAARKAHSKANFLYLLKVFDIEYILEGVPKSCLDDLADSTMQILAWLVENKKFI